MNAKPGLRWWICGLLFASTVINYVDRQTLSLLAPDLKHVYRWTNSDYAAIVIAFRVAYAIGQTAFGRLMDRLGTRRGLMLTVTGYSIVSVMTSLANGFFSFLSFRFLLGAAESGNWPGATKAVSEWFPKQERAMATAFFDSGSSLGGAVAPFIVLFVYSRWGLRMAFVLPGLLGFLWLLAWRAFYWKPEQHPRIATQELRMILDGRHGDDADKAPLRWTDLLKLPRTWGVVIARSFTDPVWFFIADWFPIYLVSKGISLKSGLIAVWIPFIAADLGNFAGGWMSGKLIASGWPVTKARKAVVVCGGIGVLAIIPTVFTNDLSWITTLFATATFAYGCFTTMANVLPSDLYPSGSVASVSGLSGTAAAIGTIGAFELIGYFSDARQMTGGHAFDPIIFAAGLIPFVGMIAVLALVSDPRSAAGVVASR